MGFKGLLKIDSERERVVKGYKIGITTLIEQHFVKDYSWITKQTLILIEQGNTITYPEI
jgi:hypothetical protein